MVAALVAATTALGQWSFTVDTSFQAPLIGRNVDDLLLNEDGSLILSGRLQYDGQWPPPPSEFSKLRLLQDGSRDPLFTTSGAGGKLTRWNDQFYSSSGSIVRRLNVNGSIDAAFTMLSPYFMNIQGGDYHVFPDGRVLISGNHLLSDSVRGFEGLYQLVWFTNTGYLDTTRIHRSSGNCAVYQFKELPTGQFIVNGICDQFDGQPVDRIFRVHTDGSVDTSFHTGVFWGLAYHYLPLDDGRVYVGGGYLSDQFGSDTIRIARFHHNGALDTNFSIPTFSAGEGLTTPLGAYVHHITPWLDGTLMVTGHFKRVNGEPRNGICLLDTTGALLPAFHSQGVSPYTEQIAQDPWYSAAVLSTAYDTTNAQLYICGAYSGYTDATGHDPDQRFITRLNVQELTTGLEEKATPQAILRLWPNPGVSDVWLHYAVHSNRGTVQLRIRDAQGRMTHTLQASGAEGQVVWDTRGIAPGVYTVELFVSGAVERTERLVIQP
jgi:hypothetical protein